MNFEALLKGDRFCLYGNGRVLYGKKGEWYVKCDTDGLRGATLYRGPSLEAAIATMETTNVSVPDDTMTFDLDTWVETDVRFPPKKTRPLVGKLIRKGRAKLPAGSYWGDYCSWCQWPEYQNISTIVTDGWRVRTTVCPRCGMGKIEAIEEKRQ